MAKKLPVAAAPAVADYMEMFHFQGRPPSWNAAPSTSVQISKEVLVDGVWHVLPGPLLDVVQAEQAGWPLEAICEALREHSFDVAEKAQQECAVHLARIAELDAAVAGLEGQVAALNAQITQLREEEH